MTIALFREAMIETARTCISSDDPAHDFAHSMRVLGNVEKIVSHEGGDLFVLIPAALLHDVVNYPKDDPRAAQAPAESAKLVAKILGTMNGYPIEKIPAVERCIERCTFSNHQVKESLEEHIVHDADMLDSVGAIALMRLFSACGQMKRPYMHAADPFCESRDPLPLEYGLDVFPARFFKIEARLHTATAKRLAQPRVAFLHAFLDQLKTELAVG